MPSRIRGRFSQGDYIENERGFNTDGVNFFPAAAVYGSEAPGAFMLAAFNSPKNDSHGHSGLREKNRKTAPAPGMAGRDASRRRFDRFGRMDPSWDTAWDADGRIDANGYTLEMAIPFKSLRFPDQEEKLWGLTRARNIPRSGEVDMWPSYSRDIPGLLSQSTPIVIRGHVEKGKNLEIMPVLTALKKQGQAADVQPGLNLKYGLNSDLTVDAAINPDFSQVEADVPQIDINLRYALRY